MTTPNDITERRALEEAGVEFVAENRGGPEVQLREKPTEKDHDATS
jgi:hypothetical protein